MNKINSFLNNTLAHQVKKNFIEVEDVLIYESAHNGRYEVCFKIISLGRTLYTIKHFRSIEHFQENVLDTIPIKINFLNLLYTDLELNVIMIRTKFRSKLLFDNTQDTIFIDSFKLEHCVDIFVNMFDNNLFKAWLNINDINIFDFYNSHKHIQRLSKI